MVAQGMVNNVMLKNNDNDGMMAGNDYRKLGGKMRELTRIIKIQTSTTMYLLLY